MENEIAEQIEKFENGEMTEEETIAFFQCISDTGLVWHLQGTYQRYLKDFVDAGLVIVKPREDEMKDE
jgi:hypothetical protein